MSRPHDCRVLRRIFVSSASRRRSFRRFQEKQRATLGGRFIEFFQWKDHSKEPIGAGRRPGRPGRPAVWRGAGDPGPFRTVRVETRRHGDGKWHGEGGDFMRIVKSREVHFGALVRWVTVEIGGS